MAESFPELRRDIAQRLLGGTMDADGFAPCPGAAHHTGPTGRRDFRVLLDQIPTASCFHTSCAGAVEDFNFRLRSEIGKAEAAARTSGKPPVLGQGMPPAPVARPARKRPPYEPARLEDFARRAPLAVAAFDWWQERSPVPVRPPELQDRSTAEVVLASLYRPGERVLVFSKQYSQGDFLFEPGRGAFRLGEQPGVAAVPAPLPAGGKEGVWFLCNPVDGLWRSNPNNRDEQGNARLGRRHAACVTAWRYAVLESDTAPADLWLRMLAQIPLPLCALYTSGGKSVHALVRIDAATKAEWDQVRDAMVPILCPLGADASALTAVRLTRLPGTMRHGTRARSGDYTAYQSPRLQRLLWLNPDATFLPVLNYVPA